MTAVNKRTTVWLLNAEGERELYCGWRVEALFRGETALAGDALASMMSERLGACVHVHAEFDDDEGRNVVLRWSTQYTKTMSSVPTSVRRPMAKRFETAEETTQVNKKFAHDSGTFVRGAALANVTPLIRRRSA